MPRNQNVFAYSNVKILKTNMSDGVLAIEGENPPHAHAVFVPKKRRREST